MISYNDAFTRTLDHISPLASEDVPLLSAINRTAAQDLFGQVDVPSVDVSLKDGYAVHSADITTACENAPVSLQLIGTVAAGGTWNGSIGPGQAVRILSGAPVPVEADAVLAEEYTQKSGDEILVANDAHPGRNILLRGSDLGQGELLVKAGVQLAPSTIGLLAAAGYEYLPVVRQPKVAILATGDEVVAPGQPLPPGKLYASNMVTLEAWCARCGFEAASFIARDHAGQIRENLMNCLQNYDAVLTSGGAWSGERDLVVRLLDELGWEKIYHRVRIGPGKAVAFGLFSGKPVFCLPGGPPSNHMAFLQFALPAIMKLAGAVPTGLPVRNVRMAETIRGQIDWTQFVWGQLEETPDLPLFVPLKSNSRLQDMSAADAIVQIPEGKADIEGGEVVRGQILK